MRETVQRLQIHSTTLSVLRVWNVKCMLYFMGKMTE